MANSFDQKPSASSTIPSAPPPTLDDPYYTNMVSPTAPSGIWDNNVHHSQEQPIAHAQVLPPDWHAQTAEITEIIPMAQAVVIPGEAYATFQHHEVDPNSSK